MTKNFLKQAFLTTLLLWIPAMVSAQQVDERITVEQGAIFEMIAFSNDDSADMRWVLTKGPDFIKAGLDSIFQMRFTIEGTYHLLGETSDGSARRRFEITVRPRTDAATATDLTTVPAADASGTVTWSTTQQILAILPGSSAQTPLSADFNVLHDSDSDGDATNDNDATGTFFSMNANPLHVWFLQPAPAQSITITIGTETKTLIIDTGVPQVNEPTLVPPKNGPTATGTTAISGTIDIVADENGLHTFKLDNEPDSKTVLFQWSFGDGTVSFLDRPTHKYTRNGTYDVSVILRDLQTGQEIETFSDSLSVDGINTPTEPIPQEPTEEEPSDESGSNLWSMLGFIFKSILAIGLSVLIGGGIMWVIGKLRKTDLSEKLEKAEQVIVGETAKKNVIDIAAPMEIQDTEEEEPEPAIQAEPVEEPRDPTPAPEQLEEELQADEEQAPDWLKSGLHQAEEIGQTVATPLQENPLQETPVVTEQSAAPAQAPTPDWLQPVVTTPSQNTPAPQPTEPQPIAPVPAPIPQEQEAPMPDWLKPQISVPAPSSIPEPVASPVPAPVAAEPVVMPTPEAVPAVQEPTPEASPSPTPAPAPTEYEAERIEPMDNDEPVAFIRAEGAEQPPVDNEANPKPQGTEEDKKPPLSAI